MSTQARDIGVDFATIVAAAQKRKKWFTRRSVPLYLMALPAIILTFMFRYVTLPGWALAFADWRISGFQGWIGGEHFRFLFNLDSFWSAFVNQWRLVLLGYLFKFPAPIIMALLLNEIRLRTYKKAVQTVTILPNFVNWVVIGGIFTMILSPRYGYVNDIIRVFGGEPVYFLSMPKLFPFLFTGMRIWKEAGYSAIIYLAALSAVDQELYEAAVIDGAGRLRQTYAVTIPVLMPTVLVLFVLSFGRVLQGFFEPILVLKNPLINETAQILDTYIYEIGLLRARYGLGVAAGLFKASIGITLLLVANWLSKQVTEDGRGIL